MNVCTHPVRRIYTDIVNDSLTEFSYDADLAGLSYSFTSHSTGFNVATSGYNDKMSALVGHVLEKVKALVVDPQRLEVIKDEVGFATFYPTDLS